MIRKILFFLLTVVISLGGHASNERGNGGGTVICKDHTQEAQIISINLVDLYVWEILEGLEFQKVYSKEHEVIKSVRERLLKIGSINFLANFDKELSVVLANWALLPSGTVVIPANDSKLPIALPLRCELFYAVNHRTINEVSRYLVNRDIVNHPLFSTLQRGALKVHEVVYAVARKIWRDADSERTQEITALLVADSLTQEQAIRLRELTQIPLMELELMNVKVTALKSFTLKASSKEGPSTTTRLYKGNVYKVQWGNWPDGLWYYHPSKYQNDDVYEVKKGDVFTIQIKSWGEKHEPIKFIKISDNTIFAIGQKGNDYPTINDINEIGLFKAEYNF